MSYYSSLLYTALRINIPGGLSKEYFYVLIFFLFIYLSLQIRDIPAFRSLCKSATLNYQDLSKFNASYSNYFEDFLYNKEK